jgi:hypothetical protein
MSDAQNSSGREMPPNKRIAELLVDEVRSMCPDLPDYELSQVPAAAHLERGQLQEHKGFFT